MQDWADRFLKDGCLVIDRLFASSMIDAAHDLFNRQYEDVDFDALETAYRVDEGRYHLPVPMEGVLAEDALLAHPMIVATMAALLGEDCRIDSLTFVVSLPGAPDQRVHRDHRSLFCETAVSSASLPPYAITLSIPLVDLDPECGTTRLWPGSHAVPSDGDALPEGSQAPIEPMLQRGGCHLMDYRLWHQGMANRSKAPRPILYATYVRPWFTDADNFARHAKLDLPEGGQLGSGVSKLLRR